VKIKNCRSWRPDRSPLAPQLAQISGKALRLWLLSRHPVCECGAKTENVRGMKAFCPACAKKHPIPAP
jgi:hypothetical protein